MARYSDEQFAKMLQANPHLDVIDDGRPPPKRRTLQALPPKRRLATGDAKARATLRGKANQAAGETFQKQLDAYHEELRHSGLAIVYRTDPPTRRTRTGLVATGTGPVDYIAFTRGGPVHFDAKVRSDAQGFTVRRKELHQLDWLHSLNAYGHRCGYVVMWTAHGVACWHPLASIDDRRIRYADGVALDGVRWMGALE